MADKFLTYIVISIFPFLVGSMLLVAVIFSIDESTQFLSVAPPFISLLLI
ncbi:MAG: hypothetical protein IPP08_12430 [Chlorobiota bacterium]|nr:hypothetical protein [Chlorobiota bacterium]QQS66545.1 MAG: hypothetical protein IPP08_12430 [Chlorobiota bacterium]